MMILGEQADIKWWFRFLTEECHLLIGHDWQWAWQDNCWAVEVTDPAQETWLRLKWPTR